MPSFAAAHSSEQMRRPAPSKVLQPGRLAWLGLGVVLTFLTAFAIGIAVTTHAAADSVRTATALNDAYEQARYAVAGEESLERKYRLEPGPDVADRHRAAAAALVSALELIRATGAPEDASLVAHVLDLHADYLASTARLFRAVDVGDTKLELQIDTDEVDPVFDSIEGLVAEAAHSHRVSALDALNRLGETEGFILASTPVVFIVGILFLVVLWAALRRFEARLEASALRELNQARLGEERFRSLVQNSADVVVIVDRTGDLRYVSPAIERNWGYRPEALDGTSVFELIHPDDLTAARIFHAECLDTPDGNIATELRLRTAEGVWRHVEEVGNNLIGHGAVDGIVLTFRDVTDQKSFEDQLKKQAFTDSLTNLPNRALFVDRLEQALARAHRRMRSVVGVLFLDLDNFKLVNDSLGHATGDLLLLAVADRLQGVLRAEDTAARLGGDEFTVLLEDIPSEADAIALAERIEAALAEPLMIDNRVLFVSASIGIAVSGASLVGPETMLRNADLAMYRAKLNGKGRHESFEQSMEGSALARIELESDLRRALALGEFRVHYQPIVSLEDGHVVELEALVRWEHPVRGMILPGEFISAAEDTGLIMPIGQWVLEEACRQAAVWNRDLTGPPINISVNLSARQFQHPGLLVDVEQAVNKAGLDACLLTLEITESVVIKDPDAAADKLREMKRLGIRVAVDDFGTGYSSLAYLKNFPIDYLKIDRSFVKGLGSDDDDAAIVRSVVALGHALNLRVIGEGIETAEQAAYLAELHCDLGQGYLFDRPMPAEDVTAALGKHGAKRPSRVA